MSKSIFSFLCAMIMIGAQGQEYFPGGVSGAETWYIANQLDFGMYIYKNHAMEHIQITGCPDFEPGEGLMNFNHAINTENLCLQYNASLENTTSRNVFFVGQAKEVSDNIAHVTTAWNTSLQGLPQVAVPIRNIFHFALKSIYAHKLHSQYSSNNNANVNFYRWNNYNTDRKFKSYGYKGETTFFIGKTFNNAEIQPNEDAINFIGDFPEYISYPFELTSNQKNRVESYLALKYGLTLADSELSYRSSRNIAFWKSANNLLFGNRIFGIGNDDVSGLNQLETQSTHKVKYLIASVGELYDTNLEKQEHSSIEKNHFIVFGDNNGSETLGSVNDFNVRPFLRTWLSQSTGENAKEINMHFKFDISGEIQETLNENPELKLWMLHDKYVTNQQQSDFNNHYVEYYDPVDISDEFAYFKDIYFDTDNNLFDQYTFGVGPEVIVQMRLEADCDAEKPNANIIITGGVAPYSVLVSNTSGFDELFTSPDGSSVSFTVYTPDTYTVYVLDSEGNEAEISTFMEHYPIALDLGPDQVLSIALQQVMLDAGQGVTDRGATYQWYKDGVVLNHHEPVLLVEEPGEYKVVVTSGNRSCVLEDTIIVAFNFKGTLTSESACNGNDGSITVNVTGGIPPFTTTVSKTGYTVSEVHNTEIFEFSNLEFGLYTITTIDSNGEIFEDSIIIESPLEGMSQPSVIAQLLNACEQRADGQPDYFSFTCSDPSVEIDASQSITNTNVSYEWFMNGVSMNIHDPYVKIIYDPSLFTGVPVLGNNSGSGGNEFSVRITNLNSGCYVTETFYLFKNLGVVDADNPIASKVSQILQNHSDYEPKSILEAKIYPNPTESGRTFSYEVSSDKIFQGTVEVYTSSGALLNQITIAGESKYILPLNLTTAGVYFICTKTEGKVLTDKVIIR